MYYRGLLLTGSPYIIVMIDIKSYEDLEEIDYNLRFTTLCAQASALCMIILSVNNNRAHMLNLIDKIKILNRFIDENDDPKAISIESFKKFYDIASNIELIKPIVDTCLIKINKKYFGN